MLRSASPSFRSSPPAMSVGIAYVDGPRLARSLFAAADWVAAGRDEINRINVFPVPDGDTGTNFSLTLRAVADALRALGDASLPETARTMARAAVLGARGNSGMMLAHFLLGFAESLGDRPSATTRDVAAAVRQGSNRLYESLDDPREGTILTVAREAAARRRAGGGGDGRYRRVHAPAARRGRRRAGTHARPDGGAARGRGGRRRWQGLRPDARGRGSLHRGRSHPRPGGRPTVRTLPRYWYRRPRAEIAVERDFQFCTELLVRGEQLPSTPTRSGPPCTPSAARSWWR